MDPYKVLGVDRNASDEEIKRKYRDLVKTYHPDLHRNNPLSELAGEKLKEINQAYDMIVKERSGGRGFEGEPGGNAYGDFARVRSLIQTGRIDEAERLLDGMASRTAEWHYLKGVILLRKGWYDGARQHFQTAYQMEPGNPEYASAFNQLNQSAAGYQNYYGGRMASDNCCQTCCCALGADTCCECFGGDCIPCC